MRFDCVLSNHPFYNLYLPEYSSFLGVSNHSSIYILCINERHTDCEFYLWGCVLFDSIIPTLCKVFKGVFSTGKMPVCRHFPNLLQTIKAKCIIRKKNLMKKRTIQFSNYMCMFYSVFFLMCLASAPSALAGCLSYGGSDN